MRRKNRFCLRRETTETKKTIMNSASLAVSSLLAGGPACFEEELEIGSDAISGS